LLTKLKAQIFSTDFIVGTSIFLIAFTILIIYWQNVNLEILDVDNQNSLVSAGYSASNILFSDGFPKGWDPSDFVALGLLNDQRLNKTKLKHLNNLGYERVRILLGTWPYKFYFEITNSSGSIVRSGGIAEPVIAYHASQDSNDIRIIGLLNDSGITWDFYWGGGMTPNNNARFVYAGDKTQLFKDIIANLSNYNTVITENSNVDPDDLIASEKQALKDWVFNIGTYVQVQQEEKMIREVFGPAEGTVRKRDGTVVNLDDILDDSVSIGNQYEFDNAVKDFSAISSPLPLKVIMEVTGNSTRCLFCKWTHGNGEIYFIPDVTDKITGDLIVGFDVVGIELKFGNYPNNAIQIFKVRRLGLFRGSIVNLEVLVWE